MTDLIDEMMVKAGRAQNIIAGWSQEQVDTLVRAAGKIVFDHAEELAADAVAETGMGNVADKILKNQGKSRNVWNFLKDKRSVGIIEPRDERGIITIAKPVGIVGAVAPTTSPTMTIMCNVMFALKGANAIIIAPHPKAKNISIKTVKLIREAMKIYDAPEDLVQCIEDPSIPLTNRLMEVVDVVVATGGPAMVKAAYSSGKPSFGVGAGNVQTIIDSDVDYLETARKVIRGRCFDNGIICSGDQSIIVPRRDSEKVARAFVAEGAFYVDEQEMADRFRAVLFEEGYTAKQVVGKSAKEVAALAGIAVPEHTRVILIKSNGRGDDVLRSEKMCPVLALFEYETLDEAITIARTNLEIRGKGHTCVIHSNNPAHIEYIGLALPVSRIAVNEPGSLSVGGTLQNGFVPTGTLGCGSWGNNSISDNFNFEHMINKQRIGFTLEGSPVPTDEEIWA